MEQHITPITTTKALEEAIAPLHAMVYITVDTEFLRERSYYPQLCLVQIGSDSEAFAVDMLAEGLDASALWELMRDEKVLKIFHACGQDMEAMLQIMGSLPAPVFDTQIAGQMLGHGEAASYGALVKAMCGGVHLDKASRHTDWSRRPLSTAQVEYALSDVTYLRTIYEKMMEQLKKRERLSWALEEMEVLKDPDRFQTHPEDAYRKLRLNQLNQKQQAIAQALANWREVQAQEKDVPRQRLLKHDTIIEMAGNPPKKVEDYKKLRFYPHNLSGKHKEALLELLRVTQEAELPKVERQKPLPKSPPGLLPLLRVLLKARCEPQKVAPSVVARSEELDRLAALGPDAWEPGDPDRPRCLSGWRFDVFGRPAVALLKGDLALTSGPEGVICLEPEMAESDSA